MAAHTAVIANYPPRSVQVVAVTRSSFSIPPSAGATATRPPLASSGKVWPR